MPNLEDEVLREVNKLLLKGETVSLNKIRSAIGHGSFSTIDKILKDNNIKTTRKASKNNIDASLSSPISLKLAEHLENEIKSANYRIKVIEDALKGTDEVLLLKELLLKEVIVQILIKHLSQENPLKTIIKDSFLSKQLSKNTTDLNFDKLDYPILEIVNLKLNSSFSQNKQLSFSFNNNENLAKAIDINRLKTMSDNNANSNNSLLTKDSNNHLLKQKTDAIDSYKEELINKLIELTYNLNPENFAGADDSLNAMRRMLKDLIKKPTTNRKTNNVQAYEYRY